MSPIVVTTMVQDPTAEPASKKVHPFFVKGAPNDDTPGPHVREDSPTVMSSEDISLDSGPEGRTAKRRKTETQAKRARRKETVSLDGSLLNHLIKSHDAPSPRPTTPPAGATKAESNVVLPSKNTLTNHGQDTKTPSSTEISKPKVLKFNVKTGTLGSPPKPKKKQLLVTLQYAKDEESRKRIGHQIAQILEGQRQVLVTPTKSRNQRSRRVIRGEGAGSRETTRGMHPLFANSQTPSGEDQKVIEPKKEPRQRQSIFMSTPVSPRKSRVTTDFDPRKVPQFGFKNNGTKIPGSSYPLWPAEGMAHIRGYETSAQSQGILPASHSWPTRKSKGHVTTVHQNESVLAQFLNKLNLATVQKHLPQDPDSFMPVPAELRLPQRHFESGRKLQKRVLPQLRTYRLPLESELDSSADELAKGPKVHHAINRLFCSLSSQLSAYDKSSCESSCWAHKYAPSTAAQVLQAGKEGLLLRDWLVALKVQSVDTGLSDNKKAEVVAKKKRRKVKLDDFVVDSSEEDDDLNEILEDEDERAPAVQGTAKTVVRGGGMNPKGQTKIANALMISGPHGCGKTAAVYAVAKELDFEVFEINSSSRRSGKDLIEKVGDMTRNHLVNRHRTKDAVDEQAAEDKISEDIKSGKQGTMITFFKPKPGADAKPQKTVQKRQKQNGSDSGHKTPPSKNQKQSLILLEEVDVLYEEDKQFWATIMTMIAQSKRPFIMTCNDESLVPVQSLNLHGIFRFASPSKDLAVDLCLLIAANEGHVLKRSAVDALYESRDQDLRATLHELNYWCQIGIGDRRGGFDWFVSRWPRGSDLDERGDTVRVIGEDTYLKGMGWISRDPVANRDESALSKEVEMMHQARNEWRFDVGNWEQSLGLQAWANSAKVNDASRQRSAMSAYESFCTTLSDSDMCSDNAFASLTTEHLDATLPELPSKAKTDYTLGRGLLEADPVVWQSWSATDITITMRSKARQTLLENLMSTTSIEVTSLEPINEGKAISIFSNQFRETSFHLKRYDVALAFDPIAVAPNSTATSHLDPSVFDRTLKLVTLDVAPFVRGIVAYDHRLMMERVKLSNLLSEGGNGKRKRMRTTRSAYSALEGGERKTTRRERYFGDVLNTGFVLRTGGEWHEAMQSEQDCRKRAMETERTRMASSGDSTETDESHDSSDENASRLH